MKKADIAVGIGLILGCIWVFWYTGQYSEATIYYYGPDFFPRILAILMALCAVVLIWRALRGKAMSPTDRIDSKGFLKMTVAVVICIGYLFLMQIAGFAESTAVFLFLLMAFLGQKGLLVRTVSSVAVSLIVWSIFRFFLIIPLPPGPLDLFYERYLAPLFR